MLGAGSSVLVSIIWLLLITLKATLAFDATRNDNLAVYYGQNSYGATNRVDVANWQQRLSNYCQDDAIDVFPLAFLVNFQGGGGLPTLDLANTCSGTNGTFNGTSLPNCQFMADDITACQARGKIITLSMGGATGSIVFTSDSDATNVANMLWDLFYGGNSTTRPFGTAVLDGVDLDIEGGSTSYYQTFLDKLQSLFQSGNKKYYTTAAPQCPFPDAYLGTVINSSPFDAVYVQFYNNFCSLPMFNNSNAWNFGQWDTWAKTQSPNKDVKVYIGAPAAQLAAGSGYVDVNTLGNIAIDTRNNYSSFGGIMLWDASQAHANNRYDLAIKNLMTGGSPPPSTTSPTLSSTTSSSTVSTRLSTSRRPSSTTIPSLSSTTTRRPPATTTHSSISRGPSSISRRPSSSSVPLSAPSPVPTASCGGVNDWVNNIAYIGGSQVVYNGELWTAKWWTYDSVPGGSAGDWRDDGPCVPTMNAAAGGQTRFCFLNLH